MVNLMWVSYALPSAMTKHIKTRAKGQLVSISRT